MIEDIDGLLKMLQTAPSGPIELDQSLLYDEPLLSDQDEREDIGKHKKDGVGGFSKNFVCRKDAYSLDSLQEALLRKRRNSNRMPAVHGQVSSPESPRGRRDTIGTLVEEAEEVHIGGEFEGIRASNVGVQTEGLGVAANVGQVQEATTSRMYGQVERRERRLEEIRKELKEREMRECTFRPNVQKKSFASVCMERGRVPVEERLLCGAGRQREEDVRRWKRELENELQKECTFNPHTTKDEVKNKLLEKDQYDLPLYKRAGQVLRSRDQLMEELEKKTGSALTFTPHIREISKIIAERKRRKEAMMKELGRVQRKDCGPSDTLLARQEEEHLSARSKVILANAKNLPTNFYQRQKYFLETRDDKIKDAIEERSQSDRQKAHFTTHTPVEVLISSERLVNQMLERPQERWNRMYSGDSDVIQKRKDRLHRQADLQHAFQPRLNPASLRMASRARNKQMHSRGSGMEEYKEEKHRECTFAPDTSKPPIMGYYGPYERPKGRAHLSVTDALKSGRFDTFMEQIEQHKRKISEKAEKLKQTRQEQELQECTFRPNLEETRDCNIQQMKGKELDNLPGVDAFMERKLLAQKQKEEKEEREARVFHQVTNHWRNCPTVVQPFNLSCYHSS